MYLGLTILGVQYALVIALGVAVLELIPFGIILAIIPSVLFAYADGGMSLSLKVLGLFVIVQQFENYLIAPLIVNKIIGVSPLVVILSILIGAKLAGFWGIILAIPVAVCLLEYLSDIEKGKSVRYTDHPNV
jgi:predicted PurR-regulated permease PerM